MKFTLEIELGNAAMQTQRDIKTAIKGAFTGAAFEDHPFKAMDSGIVRDINGNKVGKWEVTDAA